MIKNIYVRLAISFVFCLILSILPVPDLLSCCRPSWVLLLVLYIEFFLPAQFKFLAVVLFGLMLDVLLSTVMGEHAFALLIATWVASGKLRRFQFFSILQQMLYVGFFSLLYQMAISLIDALLGFNYSLIAPLTTAIASMAIWPWVRLLGDNSLGKKSSLRIKEGSYLPT